MACSVGSTFSSILKCIAFYIAFRGEEIKKIEEIEGIKKRKPLVQAARERRENIESFWWRRE
ncbi:MAG: hypothetical protein LBR53_12920 [Deltaproteobacteria bacterium]|nr:hypothetical protein [Deltaproteobacteria bacterium]